MTIRKRSVRARRAAHTYGEAAGALSYRRPLEVEEIVYFRRTGACYPRCPRCLRTVEREYTAFCDRCGQRLDWKAIDKAVICVR